jgi:hypothetical protein
MLQLEWNMLEMESHTLRGRILHKPEHTFDICEKSRFRNAQSAFHSLANSIAYAASPLREAAW